MPTAGEGDWTDVSLMRRTEFQTSRTSRMRHVSGEREWAHEGLARTVPLIRMDPPLDASPRRSAEERMRRVAPAPLTARSPPICAWEVMRSRELPW